MRKPKEKIRTPAYIRSSQPDRRSSSDMSVGDVLRIERRKLVIRQLVWVLVFLLLAAGLVLLVSMGYLEQFVDYVIERLL